MGFYSGGKYWIKLEERFVRDLMSEGGTILGSSRGGFDAEKIISAVVSRGINQIYVIGGNGAHSGIGRLLEEIQKRKL
jgi:6-phosphofructokinase 1